ncbi:MAG: Ig-like domain-containing protein, partial [Crocinitomicaceae bacterium]|nr:Ig-like domain-containing protein [Crocinitomicaceae bacterium]
MLRSFKCIVNVTYSIIWKVCLSIQFLFLSNQIYTQCAWYNTNTACTSAAPITVGTTINCTPPSNNAGRRNFVVNNMVAGCTYRISNCGSGFDTQLTVRNAAGTVVAYNDDFGPACTGSSSASIDFVCPANGTYWIQLNRWNCNTTTNQQSGNIAVTLMNCATPPINPCNSITAITCGVSTPYNLPAGNGSWNNFGGLFPTPGNEKVFSYTPTITGPVTINITTNGGGWVDLFQATACGPNGWTYVDDVFTGTPANNTVTLTAGITYYFLIDDEDITASSGAITISCPPAPCTSNTVVLNLLDSFGDGWNGATYTLTNSAGTVVSTGTLNTGSAGTVTLCLPNGCYTMSVTAGIWPGEVSWNYSFNGTTVASGGAPATNIQVPINIVCPPPPPSPQDCSGSQLVCADQAINGVSTGFGNTQDLNATNQGCMFTEHQSTWLNATVATAGTFSFNIAPTVASDYDFAVWSFPAGTIIPCPPNIPPVRCSWAAGTVNTGIGNGALDASEGATGDSWVSVMNVNPGDVILILIDNFTASTNPFTMDFTGTASLASGGIITGNTTLCVNSTSQLTSTGSPSLSTPWASSNSSVATISNTGLVSAVSAGTTTITYTNNAGCQTTTVVTVNANPNASISGVLAICGTQTTTLTASGGGTYSWSNSLGTNAAVTINSAGTYSVTVTAPNGCTAMASATVVGNVNPTISGSTTVCLNSISQLTGSGTAAASNPWTSSNTSVATVSSTGLVSALQGGTTTITYTNSSGCTASVTVSVNDIIDWANLQFPGSGSICQGGTYTIYGQLYNTGAVNTVGAGVAATGVTTEFGYSSNNTNPSTWTNWSTATFNPSGGGTQNDEYMGTLTGLAPGTYYYAFRYQINGCGWQYGGYSPVGGGIWDGTNNI